MCRGCTGNCHTVPSSGSEVASNQASCTDARSSASRADLPRGRPHRSSRPGAGLVTHRGIFFNPLYHFHTRGPPKRTSTTRILNSRADCLNPAECKPESVDRTVAHRPYPIVIGTVIKGEDDRAGSRRASVPKSERITGCPRASQPSSGKGRCGRRWCGEY